jgi:hypothetical protein
MRHVFIQFFWGIFLSSSLACFGQISSVIPEARRVDWLGAGYKGCVPPSINAGFIRSIDLFGGNSDGVTNNAAALNAVVASFGGQKGIVLFNAGTYLFSTPISLPSGIILRGFSSNQTTLKFDFAGADLNCINITAINSGSFTPITAGATKGSGSITVSNAAGFVSNGFVEIRREDASIPSSTFAYKCVGQIVEIDQVAGNVITLKKNLRLDFATGGTNLEARPIVYKENIGIENLKLNRTDSPAAGSSGSNVYMKYAINCWMKGVESAFSVGAHVLAEYCSRIEITGSYFHEALLDYSGNGTRGYGVCLNQRSGDCLVEDNIFRKLRHAMMVQAGANGNVFAYNYALETNRDEFPSNAAGDMVCHGYYPFGNLFEGNVVNNVVIDNANGANGPYNTFLRNRAVLYGLGFTTSASNSPTQNFVGNEFTGTIISGLTGFNLDQSSDSFKHANTSSAGITPVATSLTATEKSYYRTYKPESLLTQPWGNVGSPNVFFLTSTNAAAVRWNFGTLKTAYSSFGAPILTLGTPVNQTVSISTSTPAAKYQWSNSPIANGTSIGVSTTGTYALSITNDNQCVASGIIQVTSLPIELLNFGAKVIQNQGILLQWVTASETNSKQFILEKGNNLTTFEAIATINAAGFSQNKKEYEWLDTQPQTGVNYYRLSQIDLDQKIEKFRPISVIWETDVIQISPNPTDNQYFTVKGSKNATFEVFDMQGRVLAIKTQENFEDVRIEIQNTWPKGVYLLKILEDSNQQLRRIVLR